MMNGRRSHAPEVLNHAISRIISISIYLMDEGKPKTYCTPPETGINWNTDPELGLRMSSKVP